MRKAGKQKFEKPNESFLKVKYHEKLSEYKKKCKSKRNAFWQNKLAEIENSLGESKSFWEKWKNANEVYSSINKPEITGDEWEKHFSTLHTETRDEKNSEFDKVIGKMHHDPGINSPFTENEFSSAIKNLKNNKASGIDRILNEMIKNAPKIVLTLLFKFINLCLMKCLVPRSWCLEVINPIFKDGDQNDPNNYRGICISSVLMKIMCSLLNNRIQAFCKKFNVINKNQIGFKSKHRTADHLLTLKTVVKKYVTIGKKKLYACFVDFKKAFDSIWHRALFHKLDQVGISGIFLHLIKDLYKKTKCAVKADNATTIFFAYTKGVRQGCPLSPVLFNMYVNDIFELMNTSNESDICLNGDEKLNSLMYADDLILLAETETGVTVNNDSPKYGLPSHYLLVNSDSPVIIY